MRSTSAVCIVVCAASPAHDVSRLAEQARELGWEVQVAATPAALPFLDLAELEAVTGRPVRSAQRSPAEPRPPRFGAVIVAPATYNTVNKIAQGIADNYALGVVAEALGLGIPVVIAPYVNSALATRPPFRRSVADLRADGACVVLTPNPDATGTGPIDDFPWRLLMAEFTELVNRWPATGAAGTSSS